MTHLINGFLLPAFLCCIITAPEPGSGQKLRSLTEDDPGDALFLTPLIEEGAIDLARSLAQVGSLPGDGGLLSYAGYLTVNKTYNSNLYFWFFPAEVNNETAPVILWLEGGPGGSSLGSLFLENGPFIVGSNLTLLKRETSWSKQHSVLYIDNPVGTGFSFTSDENGYVTNEIEVARDLYNALIQFFKLFPELQANEFYVSGESYAGKYVPAISHSIHTNNPLADLKINLKGLIIADGYSDPVNMLNYGDYLFQIGLIDNNGREQFKVLENLCIQYIQEENWLEAFYAYDDLVANTRRYGSLFSNLTGYQMYYNYLHDKLDFPLFYDSFIQQDYVRQAIKVGNYTFNTGEQVLSKLREDFMQSVKPWIEILLENYKVLIYNGQLDVIVPYPLTVNYLSILEWSGKEDYLNAIRYQWHVGDDLAGYVKTAGNLVEVMVRNAGHLVSLDQPTWGLDLISKFIANMPLHD